MTDEQKPMIYVDYFSLMSENTREESSAVKAAREAKSIIFGYWLNSVGSEKETDAKNVE